MDANVIFDEITKPDQQIALIAKGLHAFFDSIDDKGISFRITVAAINDNKPVDWFTYFPLSDPPRTSIDSLQNQDSSICYCIRKKNIIVIEDINKESEKADERHFHPRDYSNDEEGSLICYPILHTQTGTIPYVITIVADKKDYFLNNKIQLYRWIFKHFAVRVNLEHSLLTVKGKAKNATSK